MLGTHSERSQDSTKKPPRTCRSSGIDGRMDHIVVILNVSARSLIKSVGQTPLCCCCCCFKKAVCVQAKRGVGAFPLYVHAGHIHGRAQCQKYSSPTSSLWPIHHLWVLQHSCTYSCTINGNMAQRHGKTVVVKGMDWKLGLHMAVTVGMR